MRPARVLTGKLARIRSDIHQMTSLGQVIDYIPRTQLTRLAFASLLIWIFSPLVVMISNLFLPGFDDIARYFRQSMMAGLWYIILQITGALGCLVGFLLGLKSLRQIAARRTGCTGRTGRIGLRQVLLDHLLPLTLFLFLAWSLLSALLSPDPVIAFQGTIYRKDGWFSYLYYAGVFICGYCLQDEHRIHRLMTVFCLSSGLLAILSVFSADWMTIWLGIEPGTTIFHNANHYAYYMCLAIFCSLTLFILEKKRLSWMMIYLAVFSLNSTALVLNGSFGPYLAVVFGLICCLTLSLLYQKTASRRVLLALSLFIALSLLLNQISRHLIQDVWALLTGVGQIITNDKNAGQAGSGRWQLWVAACQFILERPIFGFGPDNLGQRYLELGIVIDRPHNEILQFAASLGIPAALLYLSAVLIHVRDYFLIRKQLTTLTLGMICLMLSYWLSSLFGNTMYYTTPFFTMFWGISAGLMRQATAKSSCEQSPGNMNAL